jgi:hypothetical protein
MERVAIMISAMVLRQLIPRASHFGVHTTMFKVAT